VTHSHASASSDSIGLPAPSFPSCIYFRFQGEAWGLARSFYRKGAHSWPVAYQPCGPLEIEVNISEGILPGLVSQTSGGGIFLRLAAGRTERNGLRRTFNRTGKAIRFQTSPSRRGLEAIGFMGRRNLKTRCYPSHVPGSPPPVPQTLVFRRVDPCVVRCKLRRFRGSPMLMVSDFTASCTPFSD
jgi:hypothetical protein